MKEERLLNLIGNVDEIYIREADPELRQFTPRRSRWLVYAACLCLLILVPFIFPPELIEQIAPNRTSNNKGIYEQTELTEDGATIHMADISLAPPALDSGDALSTINYFFYQGNYYEFYSWIDSGEHLLGDYLGTVTGYIDGWEPEDGYVDFAGTAKGDIFTVNGYDPSFMLCQSTGNAQIQTYICNRGITMKYGSELFEDRLHLSENYSEVQFETGDSKNHFENYIYTLNADANLISSFIEALNTAEFIPWADVSDKEINPQYTYADPFSDPALYHVYFQMNDSTVVHLYLYASGYVRFEGMLDICVKLEQEDYDPFIQALEQYEEE